MIRRADLRDERGNAVLEFALICPVLLLLMCGLGDLAFQAYLQDVLTGEVQKAGRDSTVQGASAKLSDIDTRVEKPLRALSSGAEIATSRLSYTNYKAIAPEPFVDANGNNKYDKGECFTDINNNNSWDADPGSSGQGGAKDIAVYEVTVKYPRLFQLGNLAGYVGLGKEATISARTMLMNQPYANQVVAQVKTVC